VGSPGLCPVLTSLAAYLGLVISLPAVQIGAHPNLRVYRQYEDYLEEVPPSLGVGPRAEGDSGTRYENLGQNIKALNGIHTNLP
jgi:hypothetical protein